MVEVELDGEDGCVWESYNKNNFKYNFVDEMFFNNGFLFFNLI